MGDTAPSAAKSLSMAGTDVPAIDGPAGQERDQDAAEGAVVGRASPRATGSLEATWWPWRAISGDVTLATVASFGNLGRVFGNQGTVGRVPGADPARSGLDAAVFVQPAEWPRRRESGDGRAGSGEATL